MSRNEPVVAIIGRPNVGKSTLFNRFIGRRHAIVDKIEGITRDRLYASLARKKRRFRLVDTGGIDMGRKDRIARQVLKQAQIAIDEAEVVILVTDVRDGITPLDEDIAGLLHGSGKRVVVAVNKADNEKFQGRAFEFYRLGLGEVAGISALNGAGTERLLDIVAAFVNSEYKESHVPDAIRIALIGRPNVGKSSFLNYLLQEERVIVDDKPGTTRDSIDTYFEEGDNKFIIVDTAGIRHRRKLKEAVEFYGFNRAMKSIDSAQVVLALVDAEEGLMLDDMKVFEYVGEQCKPAVIVVNKWDLIRGVQMADYENRIFRRLKFLSFAPVVFTSAVTGRNVLRAVRQAAEIKHRSEKRFNTSLLNKMLGEAVSAFALPRRRKGGARIYYLTQVGVIPPTFILFVNNARLIPNSYRRYLGNFFRKRLKLEGVPVKIRVRGRKGTR